MKLQAKVSICLSALLMLLLVSLGGILSHFLDKSLRDKADRDLLEEAAQVSGRLDGFILNSQTDLLNIAQHMNNQALQAGQLGKIETYLADAFSSNSRFDNGFFILDGQGTLVVDYPVSESRGINLAFREYFKRTLSERKPIISSPYLSKRTGATVITFTVPLLSYQGHFLGLLAGSVNLLRYTFAGSLRDIQIGQTGKIMVYDSKGKILYYPDMDLISQEGGPPNTNPMLSSLPQGSKRVIDRQAADGTKYTMAFSSLKTTDWMVGVILPKTEILAPLNSLKKQIALFLLGALVLAVGVGIGGIGILTKPLKAFSNSIRRYKGGDWEEPAGLISRKDEIGEIGKSFKSMISQLSKTLNSLTESEIKYRLIAENSNDWIYLINRDGKFQYVSPSSERLTGYSAMEFKNNPELFLNIIHPDDKGRVQSHLEEVMERTDGHNLEFRIITREGEPRWIRHSCLPVHDEQGQYIGRSGTNRDITEGKLLEVKHEQLNRVREELITSKTLEEKLKIITDGLVDIFGADFARIWVVKPGDRWAECKHAQVNEGPHVCRYRDQCLHLMASAGRYTHLDGEMHSRVPYGCYKIGQVASGDLPGFVTNEVTRNPRVHDPHWAGALGLVSFAGYRLLSFEGGPVGVMALFSRQAISPDDDVLLKGMANSTAQVIQTAKIEETLRESEGRYRTAIEQSNDGISLVKGDRHIFVNRRMVEIFGYDRPEEIIGQSIVMMVHPDDREKVRDINRRRQKGEAVPQKYEMKGQRKNGEPIPIEVSASKTIYQGEVISLAYLRDITDRKQAEEALKALSIKDDLTGLYNRRGFFTLAEQGLKTAQRMGKAVLLIFGDLDNMKQINDTLGHKEGDQALVDISRILNKTFRESDIIARIGGDEFVILAMNGLDSSEEKLTNRFEQILHDYNLEKKRPYTLSLSLGITCFNPQKPCSIEALLAEADKIMYANKQKKRQSV